MTARIISVVSGKGGVGKSTLALNLATYIASLGLPTALIDFDVSQGNLTSHLLGPIWDTNPEQEGICSVISNNKNVDEVIVKTDKSNLYIIPSEKMNKNRVPYNIDSILKDMGLDGFMSIKNIIESSKKLNEMAFIIIDTGPKLNTEVVSVLVASSYVLLPTRMEGYSIDSIPSSIEVIEKVKRQANSKIKILGACVTLEDKRNRKNTLRADDELEKIKLSKKINVFKNRISVNASFSYLVRDRSTIYDLKSGRGSNEYTALSDEILKTVMDIEKKEQELIRGEVSL